MKEYIERFLERHFQTDWKSCTDEQLYQALLSMTQEKTQQLPKRDEKGRKLYYLSAEFLVGRLLGNNLLNLGLYEQVDNLLQSQGRSLAAIEELEAEPSLGNGGLGRLAACFLDSIATLGLYGEGIGLAYHFGLFRQRFEQNQQKEYPDRWRKPGDWMRRTEVCYPVQIGEQQVTARMYEVDVTGYQAPERTVLKLFDLEQTEEELVEQGIDFDKTDVCRNLTLFLYPDDSDREGRLLRVYQQYFLVSAAAQMILVEYTQEEEVLQKLLQIKQNNKHRLAQEFAAQGILVDENSIYDIQIKRLHEYKRQQMNALYAIWKYFEILDGRLPKRPITIIFGAKAAPAYTIAKDIIHLILCLQQLFESDERVRPYLKIVMVENYNVSWAQKLIPACDISEQISLASKEASGTGNMKLMLNGAITLGTMDGANVEIHDLVGEENICIFGKSSDEVIKLYAEGGYCSQTLYDSDEEIQRLVDFIIDKKMIRIGDPLPLCRLYKEMLSKDYFMTLLDLKEYIRAKEKLLDSYEDRMAWARKMLVNIANAGYFSSDRTIAQYEKEIWKLSEGR